ncbi:MAG: cytochrome C [Pseudomonadota bacterium]
MAALPFVAFGEAQKLPDRLAGHGGPIRAVTVSDDGTHVLTASFDYALILWDISGPEAKIVHRMTGHAGAVNDAEFVPERNWAVSVGDDGAMAAWDLGTGEMLWLTKVDAYKALDLDLTADGKLAAMGKWDRTARIVDVATGEIVSSLIHRTNVQTVAFDSAGGLLTGTYGGEIWEWDLARPDAALRPLVQHGWGINSIAMLPNGTLVFGALDGTFARVDLFSGITTELAKTDRPIQTVKLSQDNALVGYGDGTGKIGIYTMAGSHVETGVVTYGPVWDFDFVPGTAEIYHVGLDDFAALWRIAPRDFTPIQAELPRRFQIRESEDPGELEFLRKCSVCHTLTPDDAGRAGPTLYGLFGRPSAALPDYPYSKALEDLNVIWTEETVAQLFDDGPDIMVPGTKMPIQRLKSIERRDDLIRYLKTATAIIE